MNLRVDDNIVQAVDAWVAYGIPPGSCTEHLLRGNYDRAYLSAHKLIKPYWTDHIAYINTIPLYCRNENYDSWRGMERYLHRVELEEELFNEI